MALGDAVRPQKVDDGRQVFRQHTHACARQCGKEGIADAVATERRQGLVVQTEVYGRGQLKGREMPCSEANGLAVIYHGGGGDAEYVKTVQHRVVLIDGDELARLLVRHGVGVREDCHIVIKKLDEDYFSDG